MSFKSSRMGSGEGIKIRTDIGALICEKSQLGGEMWPGFLGRRGFFFQQLGIPLDIAALAVWT